MLRPPLTEAVAPAADPPSPSTPPQTTIEADAAGEPAAEHADDDTEEPEAEVFAEGVVADGEIYLVIDNPSEVHDHPDVAEDGADDVPSGADDDAEPNPSEDSGCLLKLPDPPMSVFCGGNYVEDESESDDPKTKQLVQTVLYKSIQALERRMDRRLDDFQRSCQVNHRIEMLERRMRYLEHAMEHLIASQSCAAEC